MLPRFDAHFLSPLVDRVELRPECIRLSLKLPVSAGNAATPTHLSLTRELPMLIRRWGIKKRFIIDDGAAVSSTVDRVPSKQLRERIAGLRMFSPADRWSRLPSARGQHLTGVKILESQSLVG
jgi:hypothetical protein